MPEIQRPHRMQTHPKFSQYHAEVIGRPEVITSTLVPTQQGAREPSAPAGQKRRRSSAQPSERLDHDNGEKRSSNRLASESWSCPITSEPGGKRTWSLCARESGFDLHDFASRHFLPRRAIDRSLNFVSHGVRRQTRFCVSDLCRLAPPILVDKVN